MKCLPGYSGYWDERTKYIWQDLTIFNKQERNFIPTEVITDAKIITTFEFIFFLFIRKSISYFPTVYLQGSSKVCISTLKNKHKMNPSYFTNQKNLPGMYSFFFCLHFVFLIYSVIIAVFWHTCYVLKNATLGFLASLHQRHWYPNDMYFKMLY